MSERLYQGWQWTGSRWIPAAEPTFERARLMLYDEGRLVLSAECGNDPLVDPGRVRLFRPEGRHDYRPLSLGQLRSWYFNDERPRLQLEAPRITLRYLRPMTEEPA